MLMIKIPKANLPALNGDGAKCSINGEDVTMRLKDGYLIYHGEGMENRCKVLMQDVQPDGSIDFLAASHGQDDERHAIFGLNEKGEPVDFLDPKPLPGLPGGPPLQ
jgi:hypothetical protein